MSDRSNADHSDGTPPLFRPIDQPGSVFYSFIAGLDLNGIGSLARESVPQESEPPEEEYDSHSCNYWSIAFRHAAFDQFAKRVEESNDHLIHCPEGMRNVEKAYRNLARARSHYDLNLLMISSGCDDGGSRIGVDSDLDTTNACPGLELVVFRVFKGSTSERQWAINHLPSCESCAEAVGALRSLIDNETE